jgi:tetratricopeptide (TPR) repeat protein
VALEALRDVEADRRAGSLDDAAYAEQLGEAEARAATTRAALDAATRARPSGRARASGARVGLAAAAAIGVALLAGTLVPASGIANGTVVNQGLADAREAEASRQALIVELLDQLAADPEDTDVLSDLADAYLAGSDTDDLVRGAVSLQVLIGLDPERADAYERIMSAYLRAGDHANARAAHDAYAQLDGADPVEAAFFDGLIALRGEDDPAAAADAFDRFLELAPDDPRAGMVRGLRDETAGE